MIIDLKHSKYKNTIRHRTWKLFHTSFAAVTLSWCLVGSLQRIWKKYLGCQQLWSAAEVWQTFEKYFWTNLTLLQGLSNTALCWLNHDIVPLCYLRGEAIISPSWFVREFWIEVDCRVGCYSLCPGDFKRCFRFWSIALFIPPLPNGSSAEKFRRCRKRPAMDWEITTSRPPPPLLCPRFA